MTGTIGLEEVVDDLYSEGDEERERDLGDITLAMEDCLEIVDAGVKGPEVSLPESLLAFGAVNVTIFTPMPLSLVAGMNRVVSPSLLFTEIRDG